VPRRPEQIAQAAAAVEQAMGGVPPAIEGCWVAGEVHIVQTRPQVPPILPAACARRSVLRAPPCAREPSRDAEQPTWLRSSCAGRSGVGALKWQQRHGRRVPASVGFTKRATQSASATLLYSLRARHHES